MDGPCQAGQPRHGDRSRVLAQLHVVKANPSEQDREGGGCTRIGLLSGGGVRTEAFNAPTLPTVAKSLGKDQQDGDDDQVGGHARHRGVVRALQRVPDGDEHGRRHRANEADDQGGHDGPADRADGPKHDDGEGWKQQGETGLWGEGDVQPEDGPAHAGDACRQEGAHHLHAFDVDAAGGGQFRVVRHRAHATAKSGAREQQEEHDDGPKRDNGHDGVVERIGGLSHLTDHLKVSCSEVNAEDAGGQRPRLSAPVHPIGVGHEALRIRSKAEVKQPPEDERNAKRSDHHHVS